MKKIIMMANHRKAGIKEVNMNCKDCLSYSICTDEDKGCAICEAFEQKEKVCCLCGKKFYGWGNNPWPLNKDEDARCCDDCNNSKVLAARLLLMK